MSFSTLGNVFFLPLILLSIIGKYLNLLLLRSPDQHSSRDHRLAQFMYTKIPKDANHASNCRLARIFWLIFPLGRQLGNLIRGPKSPALKSKIQKNPLHSRIRTDRCIFTPLPPLILSLQCAQKESISQNKKN